MDMIRTTIMLDPTVKSKAEALAKRAGISLSEYIRLCLKKELDDTADMTNEDPFWSDTEVVSDEGPVDMASRHDDYLDQ